jgi:hypothetical protein
MAVSWVAKMSDMAEGYGARRWPRERSGLQYLAKMPSRLHGRFDGYTVRSGREGSPAVHDMGVPSSTSTWIACLTAPPDGPVARVRDSMDGSRSRGPIRPLASVTETGAAGIRQKGAAGLRGDH